MGNLLYVIALFMIIIWAIGLFAYGASGIIHILLVLALISVLFRIFTGKRGTRY